VPDGASMSDPSIVSFVELAAAFSARTGLNALTGAPPEGGGTGEITPTDPVVPGVEESIEYGT